MPSNDRGRYKRILCFTSKLAALDKINNCTKGKINIIGNIALFLKICLNFCMMNSMVLMFCFLALIWKSFYLVFNELKIEA
jgi:hypothetical protein